MYVNTETKISLRNAERKVLKLLLDAINTDSSSCDTARAILEADYVVRLSGKNEHHEDILRNFIEELIRGM